MIYRIACAATVASVFVGCAQDSPETSVDVGADTLLMEVSWQVARGLHPANDSLGQVTGVAVDESGNVYVSDAMAAKLWVFGSDGRLRTSIGRKGDGPGEFEAPTGVAIGPDGRLYVRDVYRVSRFGENPETGLLTEFEGGFDGPVYADWTSIRTTRFDSSGAVFYPGSRWLEEGTAVRFFIRYTAEGEILDTIPVPNYDNAPQLTAFVRTGPGGGRMLSGLNHVPFAPLPVWDITPEGTVVSGDAELYQISETGQNGEVIQHFERSIQPVQIPRTEHDDSVRALRARIDSIPVAVDQVEGVPDEVLSANLPAEYPAYQAVYAEANGEVWIRRWTPMGEGKTILDVFSRDGKYLETVVLPRFIEPEPTPALSRAGIVGVALDPVTGEAQIIRFDPLR